MNSRGYPFALAYGTEISGYVIERVLGAGGFGITYAATNPVTGITVAVKEFYPQGFASREGSTVLLHADVSKGSYEQALRKFEQEAAKLTARYRHPNIVRGLNFLRLNNTAYFIMEFVSGVSLDDWLLAKTVPPDEPTLRGIFEQVLDAVDYIHSRDGMHRDLTPKNVMIRADGSAVLVDFGASGEGLDTDRGHSTAFAQPNYAPPEQLAGDDSRMQGRHTDIFSLGGVLYRALSGHPPVKPLKRSHDVAMSGPDHDPYVPARLVALRPDFYSARFLSGVDAALRLDYRRRPATIADLRRELGWLDDDVTAVYDASPRPPLAGPPAVPPPLPISAPMVPPPRGAAPMLVAPVMAEDAGYRPHAPIHEPSESFDDTATAETEFRLEPQKRTGLLLPLTLMLGVIVAGLLAWYFATGDSPLRTVVADQGRVATNPANPQPQPPKQPQKDPPEKQPRDVVKEPLPPAVKEPVVEPAKTVPKVDFTELTGFAPVGKELAQPTPAPTTADTCRAACADDQQCRGFAMAADACKLYGEVTGLTPEPDRRMSLRSDSADLKIMRQRLDVEAKRRAAFKRVDGVTLPGGTATAKTVVTQEQCRFACVSDGTCKGISFSTLVGACRLHKEIAAPQAKPAVGFVTLIEDADGQLSEQIRRSVLAKTRTVKGYSGLELGAASARHAPAADAAACRQSCLEDKTCTAATFIGGDCARLSDVETLRTRPGAETVADVGDTKLAERVDEFLKREAKGEAELFVGYDLVGTPITNDKTKTVATLDDCQAVCRETGTCSGYSFIHAEKKCLLVSGVSDTIPDPTRSSGLFRGTAAAAIDEARRRIQQSEAQRANYRDMPANCNPQGAVTTLQLPTQAVPEQCAFLCRSGASCQAWVFNRADRSCGLLSSVTGATVAAGLQSGLFDPTGKRVGELLRACGPIPPAALTGTNANECDRQAGYIYDPDLPRGIAPRPFEYIDPARAIPACERALDSAPSSQRWRLQLGRAYERDGRAVEARTLYREAADDGNASAAYLYAIMANKGQGGLQDDQESEKYFKLARSRGFAPASTALGLLYAYSDRVAPANEADALQLLQDGAARGHALAMYRLAEAFEKGRLNRRPVPLDPALAQQWYQRAYEAFRRDADGKDVNALRFLSLQYDLGRGTARDPEQALQYLVSYLSTFYGPDNAVARERGTVGDLRMDDWSADTRKAFQQYLRERGVFQDAIDGTIGARTVEAVDRWLGLSG